MDFGLFYFCASWAGIRHLNQVAWHRSARLFFRWDISVICPEIVLKLAVTVFTSLPFRKLWPNRLHLFSVIKKKFGQWPKNTGSRYQEAGENITNGKCRCLLALPKNVTFWFEPNMCRCVGCQPRAQPAPSVVRSSRQENRKTDQRSWGFAAGSGSREAHTQSPVKHG